MSRSISRQSSFEGSIGKAVVLESSSVPFVQWEQWGNSVVHSVYHTNDTVGVLGSQPDLHLVDEIKRNHGIICRDGVLIRTLDIEPGADTVSIPSPKFSVSLATDQVHVVRSPSGLG